MEEIKETRDGSSNDGCRKWRLKKGTHSFIDEEASSPTAPERGEEDASKLEPHRLWKVENRTSPSPTNRV